MSWLPAFGLGAVVGLGVALPLGAIGVLLVQTGMTRGWRQAAAGGVGVATVDLLYAAIAVVAGTAVSGALDGHERAVRWAGAAVLAAVAVRGVLRMRQSRVSDAAVPGAAVPGAAVPGAAVPGAVGRGAAVPDVAVPAGVVLDAGRGRGGPAATYLRFLGLTAVNPLTVVYFTAVVAGLGDRLAATSERVGFVVGVGLASAAWQVALAGLGAVLGARVSPRVGAVLTGAGYAVVGAFAVTLAVG